MNGKKQHIRRNDFLHFADTIGLPRKSAEKLMEQIVKREETYVEMCRDSYMPEDMKESLEALIRERIHILRK